MRVPTEVEKLEYLEKKLKEPNKVDKNEPGVPDGTISSQG